MGVQINGDTGNISATKADYSGNVTIGGTLTYEDVTNIDSVGLITARNGIEVGARPGVAASISVDGNMIVSGISTFGGTANFAAISGTTGTFTGDVDIADKIVHTGDTDTALRFPAADTITAETGGTERLRITSGGLVGVNETPAISQFQVKTAQLGGTSGNTQEVVRLHSPDVSNTTSYRFTNYRTSNGTSHTTSELRFRRHVDSTDMGYFGLADGKASIGYGSNEWVKVSSEGYVTKPQTPFFSVYGTGSNQTYNDGDVIDFENATHNVGSHFKMTSGTGQYERFIAPVAGVYIFTFGFFPNSASNCRISLAVNGTVFTAPYISGCFTAWGTGVPAPSGSQMLKLSASDYVDVRITGGTLTNTYDGHTAFQGFLLG